MIKMEKMKRIVEGEEKIVFGRGTKVHIKFGSSSMCGYWNGYIIATNKPVTCKKCLEWQQKSKELTKGGEDGNV